MSNKLKVAFYAMSFWVLIMAGFLAYSLLDQDNKLSKGNNKTQSQNKKPMTKPTEKPKPIEIKILAVGDNLLHVPVINSVKTEDENRYNFKPIFEKIQNKVSAADIAFINQEVVTGGDDFEISGYPAFNAPSEVQRDIAELGFDVVNQASNHSLDKDGAMETALNNWDNYKNVSIIGAARSPEESDKIDIVQSKGVKIAFLGYTYGTNGIPVPEDRPYLVNLIDKEKIKNDILRAKKETNIIVVSMHWGEEYQHVPSEDQKDLAKFLADEGVNLVIGHHPHVIQPVEKVTGVNGNITTVVYSLGNLISSQDSLEKLLGGMMEVVLVKEPDGSVLIKDTKMTPLVTHYDSSYANFKIIPLNEYTEEVSQEHCRDEMRGALGLEKLNEIAKDVFGGYLNTN